MSQHKEKTTGLVLCALFAALIAAGAFIRIPLGALPVTLQTLFVTLAGLLLGSRWGGAAAAVYAAMGLVGVPVFTGGGGPSYVLNPSFGYIIGFILGAWVTGRIAERAQKNSVWIYLLAGLVGIAAAYAVGVPYFAMIEALYLHTPVGAKVLLVSYVLRLIPKELLCCFLCAVLAKRLRPVLTKITTPQTGKSAA